MFLLAAGSVTMPLPAFAQAQPVPQGAVPSRDQVNPPTAETDRAAGNVRVDSHGALPAGPCPLPEDLSVTIREVRFTAVGGGDLPPELSNLLGGITTDPSPQSIRVVCSLRDRAIERLRSARYVASVQIPQQRIADGVLRLEVVSGHVVQVRVQGEPGPYRRLLERRIAALKAMDPFNEATAERILLLSQDVPGLSVKLGLSPAGTRPGELVGDLTVDFTRIRVVANVQNYNSAPLGRESLFLHTEVYGLTGLADVTSFSGLASTDFRKQLIAQVSHAMQLAPDGLTFAVTGTLAQSRPKLLNLDLRTVSKVVQAEFRAPYIRGVNTNVSSAIGFEFAEQRTRVFGAGGSQPLFRDRIATFYSRISGATRKVAVDGHTIYAIGGNLEFRRGINALGANQPGVFIDKDGYAPSRVEGNAVAGIIRGDITGQVGIGPVFELFARGHGQYTNRPLLNYDEFAIGNLTMGRGYDPGANTGDQAIGGSFEARGNFRATPQVNGQVFAFYDIVKIKNLDTFTTEKNRTLRSVGAGFRVNAYSSARLEVTYVHPMDPPLLTGVNVRRPSDRVLVSLTTQLVPFGPR